MRRPRRALVPAILVVTTLVAVAVVAVLVRDGRHDIDPGGRDGAPAQARPGAATGALAALVEVVERRDLVVAAARFEKVAYLVHNAETLDVRDFSLRYVDELGAPVQDGSWLAEVEATWRFAGFDSTPARARVVARFGPGPGGVTVRELAREIAGDARAPLWLSREVVASRSHRALVLVAAAPDASEAARTISRVVERGTATVRRSLPDWRGRVVVEQPRGAADVDRGLGAPEGTYRDVAAVTAPVGATDDGEGPVHVYLNPDVGARMDARGREVVIAHELVHVATDAARSTAEPWLLEGFADYVALRFSEVPDEVALGNARADVRRNGVPGHLPDAEDFATSSEDLQAAYEQAWLACRAVARRIGHQGLVDVYDRAGADVGLRRILAEAGFPYRRLVDEWRSSLRALAE